ncbi:pre-mRNA-processing factor 39 isoform X1 [Entelurus aequoreus]|uniref:pre-mRNA-processing factor 39 isoform X1 n=2 Tax=Entelurus aequoreus TaxID=161455 RepID=UPI002B1E7889|nr:pre-mRNA-processing factor 39 isoform X1 [Entelurus aequoreus]
MAAESEMRDTEELGEPSTTSNNTTLHSAMEVAEVPTKPLPEMLNENTESSEDSDGFPIGLSPAEGEDDGDMPADSESLSPAEGEDDGDMPADSEGLSPAADQDDGDMPADSEGLSPAADQDDGDMPADSEGLSPAADQDDGDKPADSEGLSTAAGEDDGDMPADSEGLSPAADQDDGDMPADSEGLSPAADQDDGDKPADSEGLSPAADQDDGDMPADFDGLWEAAHSIPQDFSSWTNLLKYCEQERHFAASRRALVAFLARYPLCYGYWKKYADLERRAGNNDKALEVCVQGLQAIPLSVDLWIHYINLLLGMLDMSLPESPQRIRSVFEDAVGTAGLEFHSDRLWELYVDWEKEHGNVGNAAAILDRVLRVPTQSYSTHYDKLKAHVSSHPPKEVLWQEEYEEVRALCRERQRVERDKLAKDKDDERPPGEDQPATPEGVDTEEMMQRIREEVLLRRDLVYRKNEEEVRKRWNFEDALKRPYFHVRPLDQIQLQGWHSYLDWEMAQQNQDPADHNTKTEAAGQEETDVHRRVCVLFERCLIACALYQEFWTRYVEYLEPLSVDRTRGVYKRACEIHLPCRPNLHMQWATFEEKHGDLAQARRVLEALEKTTPGLAVVRLRRVALERRAGRLQQSQVLLQEALVQSKEKPALHAFYSIKLARLLLKICRNPSRARGVLQEALEISPDNDKLYLNWLELELDGEPWSSVEAVQQCVRRALAAPLPPNIKLRFSQRRLQFVEEYCNSIKSVLCVYDDHQELIKELGGTKRPAESRDEKPEKQSKGDDASTVVVAPAQASTTAAPVPTTTTTPTPPAVSVQAGYGAYSSTWYQQPQYSGYGYQNPWNYHQGYYPPS